MRCGTLLRLTWKKGANRLQLVHREALLVYEQLSVSPSDRVLPGQSVAEGVLCDNTSAAFGQVGTCSLREVLDVTLRRSGGARSARTSCRADSALSDGLLDGGTVTTTTPLGSQVLGVVGTLEMPPSFCRAWIRLGSRMELLYFKMAKHMEEAQIVDGDVASYAASKPRWAGRAKLSWRKTKSGRRRARQVGSGGTRSSLPTIV
eukprot:2612603-Amphidinium_carterae.1